METPYIGVGHVPGRKSMALSLVSGSTIRVLAYFVSEEAADEFLSEAHGRVLMRDTADPSESVRATRRQKASGSDEPEGPGLPAEESS